MLFRSEFVDGAFLDRNLPSDLPAVLLDSPVDHARYPSINIDNIAGAQAMVKHLLDAGHPSVAFITGPAGNYDAQEREKGYRAAMARHAPKAKLNIVAGDFTEESGYRAGREILAQSKRPRAVFAANDMTAVGCLMAFKEAGVKVPEDIALAGFDDILIARYVTPSLSTVGVSIADLGKSALLLLTELMEGKGHTGSNSRTLRCDVVVRESCGAHQTTVASKQPPALV